MQLTLVLVMGPCSTSSRSHQTLQNASNAWPVMLRKCSYWYGYVVIVEGVLREGSGWEQCYIWTWILCRLDDDLCFR